MSKPVRVAVAAGKGGVGKSSLVAGLASVFASRGRRVLVLDVDPQANAAWALAVDPTAAGVAELLRGETPALLVSPVGRVLAPGAGLAGVDVARLEPEALRDALDETADGFDVVVIDSPPGSDALERFAVVAADVVLVAVDAHPFSIAGSARVIRDLEARRKKRRPGASRWAFVMSKVDERRRADRELSEALAASFPIVPRFALRQDAALSAATAERVPLMIAAPTSRAAEDLARLADWIENP